MKNTGSELKYGRQVRSDRMLTSREPSSRAQVADLRVGGKGELEATVTAKLARRQCIRAGSFALGLVLWNRGVLSPIARAAGERLPKGRVIHVGRSREVKSLREASVVAQDGDQILVDPGEYRGDTAVWTQRSIFIRGNGDRPVLTAAGASAEGKGIFVFRGGEALVENMSFTGAKSPHSNGAGIRLDVGGRLAVRGCHFQDNENGILTSNDPASELHITDSEFIQNGAGDGQSHNLYVGLIGKLTVTGCYFARARVGHLLKSRARDSVIMYSRLTGEDGTSSYELEFPSGGRAVVLGCLIQQGPRSENSTILSYGAEGHGWERNELLVSFSTIVNDRASGGTFVRLAPGAARAELVDNLLVGPGRMDLGPAAATVRNLEAKASDFSDVARYDYRLRKSSRLLGAAGMAGVLEHNRVRPEREYLHPASSVALEPYAPMTALSPGAFQRIVM